MSQAPDSSSASSDSSPASGLLLQTHFVRGRNALMARANFSELFVDYYLHLAEFGLKPQPEHDAIFKDALAAFTLHCASRPKHELIAWTLHFQEPLFNLFLIGDNDASSVAGRTFDENVKQMDTNHFYADVVRGHLPPRRSAVTFPDGDPFRAVEKYYRESEQRPARLFRLAEEEFAIVCSHPDCDEAWFNALDAATVAKIPQTESLGLLESRRYRWECGCSERKIMGVLAPAMRASPETLFDGEASVQVRCPRCGAKYIVTREALEAFLEGQGGGTTPPAPPPAS